MRLRLIWKTARNAPDGLDQIRGKLRQTVDAWSAAGWTEALTRALDYRAWHEFAIQRLQDGQ